MIDQESMSISDWAFFVTLLFLFHILPLKVTGFSIQENVCVTLYFMILLTRIDLLPMDNLGLSANYILEQEQKIYIDEVDFIF